MAKPNDERKASGGSKLDRRAVIRGALMAGGITALASVAMPKKALAAQAAPGPLAAEREWARALARHVANQLPEAARTLPNLGLTREQVQELKRAFENTLITNMGCELPPT